MENITFSHSQCRFKEIPAKQWFLFKGKLYYKEFFEKFNAIGYDEDWAKINEEAFVEWVKKIENPDVKECAKRRIQQILNRIK